MVLTKYTRLAVSESEFFMRESQDYINIKILHVKKYIIILAPFERFQILDF